MNQPEQAISKKFVSQLRGLQSLDGYYCFSTFNYENYQIESRESFGMIEVVNEEKLSPQNRHSYSIATNCHILLIPLVGALDFESEYTQGFVHADQVACVNLLKDSCFTISNPYTNDWVSYLQIRMTGHHPEAHFDFCPPCKNELQLLCKSNSYSVTMGLFDS